MERNGFSFATAGMAAGASGIVGAVGRVVWAYISERWGEAPGWMALLSGGSVASLGLLAFAEALGSGWIWAAAIGMGVTAGTWNVVAQLTVIRENDRSEAARASGCCRHPFC